MRAANITTGIAAILWFGLFVIGRELTYGIYTHGAGVFPNSGQIDWYIVFPVCVVATLMLCAWICNIFRWAWPLLALSIVSIVALFPFLLAYGGGV